MKSRPDNPQQLPLFDTTPHAVDAARQRATSRPILAVTPSADVLRVAAKLDNGIHLGTSSWSFPGWAGIVYGGEYTEGQLARDGLAAYAAHPLFRAVGVDRTYYAPVAASVFREYAEGVPAGFRFLVKAHEWVTSPRVFQRSSAEGGGVRLHAGESPHFLDAAYTCDKIVGPFVEGLGEKAGPLVFQFVPMNLRTVGGVEKFLDRLHQFLDALPRGPLYAVELRNEPLLTPRYLQVLQATGVAHCYNGHGRMPALAEQISVVPLETNPAIVVRWMLNPKWGYEEARAEYAPFDRIVDEDVTSRNTIAEFCRQSVGLGKAAFVIVNNKAEGSSPLSLVRLAEAIERMSIV